MERRRPWWRMYAEQVWNGWTRRFYNRRVVCMCIPWAEEGLVGVGVGEVAEVAELHRHRRLGGPQEAADELGRPGLGRRRPAARRHQLRRHLHHPAAEHRQHPRSITHTSFLASN